MVLPSKNQPLSYFSTIMLGEVVMIKGQCLQNTPLIST